MWSLGKNKAEPGTIYSRLAFIIFNQRCHARLRTSLRRPGIQALAYHLSQTSSPCLPSPYTQPPRRTTSTRITKSTSYYQGLRCSGQQKGNSFRSLLSARMPCNFRRPLSLSTPAAPVSRMGECPYTYRKQPFLSFRIMMMCSMLGQSSWQSLLAWLVLDAPQETASPLSTATTVQDRSFSPAQVIFSSLFPLTMRQQDLERSCIAEPLRGRNTYFEASRPVEYFLAILVFLALHQRVRTGSFSPITLKVINVLLLCSETEGPRPF